MADMALTMRVTQWLRRPAAEFIHPASSRHRDELVDVVADLPADAQPAEPVQQRDGLLDDPAVHAQAGAVFGAAAGDDRA